MIILRPLLLFSLLFSVTLLPQEKPTLSDIRNAYTDFEYRQVITLANLIFQKGDSLNVKEANEVLLMKAVSHYALAEEQLTRKTFIEMLKNDKTAALDSAAVSPKIVAFFLQVKNDFLEMVPPEKPKDQAQQANPEKIVIDNSAEVALIKSKYDFYRSCITKSFLLPGLGHYSLGEETKGAILAAATVVNAGALIYYIYDTGKKETSYLSETTESGIKSAYSSYNTSYKVRNTLITSLAAIWIYAQTDLLFSGNSVYFSAVPQFMGNRGMGVYANLTAAF